MIGADAQEFQSVKIQIEALINTLAESWNRHDMASYGAQFADDADFVNVLGMHWRGRKPIEEAHAALHGSIFRNSLLKILDCSVRPVGSDVALAVVRWEMTGHETPPGVPFQKVRHGVITGVFTPREGRWLIAALQNTEVVKVELPL